MHDQRCSNRRTCSEGEDVEVALGRKVVEEQQQNFLGTAQSIALQDEQVPATDSVHKQHASL